VTWHNGDRLYVPLIGDKGILGVMDIDRPQTGLRPTEAALQVIEIMAAQAAAGLRACQVQTCETQACVSQDAGLCADQDQVLDEQIAELSTLLEIDRQLNARPDFGYVMDTTLDWAMQITSAVAGTLTLLFDQTDMTDAESCSQKDRDTPDSGTPDPSTQPMTRSGQEPAQVRQMLRVVAHRGYSPKMDEYWHIPWPTDEGIIGQAIQTGRTSIVQDVALDGDCAHVATSPRAHLATPIVCGDRMIGVIGLESARRDGFTENDVRLLESLSSQAAVAIQSAQLYEQSKLRAAELCSLQEISLDLFSSLLPDSVLDRVAAHARSITQADRIDIYVYDDQKDALSYGTGLSYEGTCDQPPIPVQQNPLAPTVARQRQAKAVYDARQHPLLVDRGWTIGSIASIPISHQSDRVLGVLEVSFKETHAFSDNELRVLRLLCQQAAIAIENARLLAGLQHANDTKNELTDAISHALMVPLTSIQGYARLMALETGGPITEQQRAFLDTILRNTRQTNALIKDQLDLSRIESGKIQAPPESIDLSKTIEQAVRTVCRELDLDRETKDQKPLITVRLDQELPTVRADKSWLTRVWTNLLRNALRYTPDGGQVEVWVQRRRPSNSHPTAKQWVLCAVNSPGIEFSAEESKKVFEPFHKMEHAQEPLKRGTGLELAISRAVVELYGGQIWAESDPGAGNTVFFTLPQAEQDSTPF
jgi:signal transduction histidine kinase